MWPVVRWPQLGEVAIVQSVDERGEQVLCRIDPVRETVSVAWHVELAQSEGLVLKGPVPVDVCPSSEVRHPPRDRSDGERVGRGPGVFAYPRPGAPACGCLLTSTHRPARRGRLPEAVIVGDVFEQPPDI